MIDGSEHLDSEPLTLNAPFPSTRSGFFKVSFLVEAKPNTDFEAFFAHWLNAHVPNVTLTMHEVDGFRYVVSLSLDPAGRDRTVRFGSAPSPGSARSARIPSDRR